MMNFEIIEEALVTLLGEAAGGRFLTLGYQNQGQSAEELLDDNRNIQVYYNNGEFPKSKSSINGPTQHDPTFNIDCMVSKRAEVDLSVLEDDEATSGEKAIALAAIRPAAQLANKSLNELFRIVYQIIMDARNQDLGSTLTVASRWIERINKDSPIPAGEYCVLTGIMQVTCSIDEQLEGETPVEATGGVSMDLQVNGEPEAQAGVTNEHTYLIDDETGDLIVDDETGEYVIEG